MPWLVFDFLFFGFGSDICRVGMYAANVEGQSVFGLEKGNHHTIREIGKIHTVKICLICNAIQQIGILIV